MCVRVAARITFSTKVFAAKLLEQGKAELITSKTSLLEGDCAFEAEKKNQSKTNPAGVGVCVGRIVNPYGANVDVHFADAITSEAMHRRNLRRAPREGDTIVLDGVEWEVNKYLEEGKEKCLFFEY